MLVYRAYLLKDGDKKVVSKQPFTSLSKSQFTAILRILCQITLILSLAMNYSIVINKCF